MRAGDRRTRIVAEVNSKGYVTVTELSHLLDVSEVTIRTDLSQLDRKGFIRRGFGGAMALQKVNEKTLSEPENDHQDAFDSLWSSTAYSTSMVAEKVMIAKVAATVVTTGDIVILDGSNTSYFLARELAAANQNIVAVTNSMDILDVFRPASNINVILLGGEFHEKYNASFGELTESAVKGIKASKVFLSPKSLDVTRGALMDSSMANAVRRAMLQAATACYVLADHSKFSGRGIMQLAEWSEVSCIITDQQPPKAFEEVFTNSQIPCRLPD